MPWPDVDAVVIGTSAGGVNALLQIVAALPRTFPLPMLAVLHRGERSGALATLLAQHSQLRIADALDKQPLQGGELLLAPADYHLLVEQGPRVALSLDAPVMCSRPAIDPLFETAAEVFGSRLLGIIMTGASSDGAAGARAVCEAGGELWVQDPAEAVATTMPQAAIDSAGASRIQKLDAICKSLGELEWR